MCTSIGYICNSVNKCENGMPYIRACIYTKFSIRNIFWEKANYDKRFRVFEKYKLDRFLHNSGLYVV